MKRMGHDTDDMLKRAYQHLMNDREKEVSNTNNTKLANTSPESRSRLSIIMQTFVQTFLINNLISPYYFRDYYIMYESRNLFSIKIKTTG